MSLLSRAQELEDISDAQLAQLVQQGSEAGDTWLAATETQRRKDMRDRYQAEQAKQQAANPPDIMTQRLGELGGGIPSTDPNIGAPPDPSLQTGIAGPPPGMAGGGLIRGYQQGGGGFGDPVRPRDTRESIAEYDKLLAKVSSLQGRQSSAGLSPVGSAEEEAERLWQQGVSASDLGFGWGAQTPTTTADVVTAERAAASELREIERVSARLMALNPDMDPAEAARRAGADVDSDAITFDPDTGRAMRDGEFYGPEDDRLGSNMVQLLKMKAAAIAANDPDELRKVEAGIAELERSMAHGPRTGDDIDQDWAQDIFDRYRVGGAGGMGTLQDVYGAAEGRITDYTDLLRTLTPEDEERDRLRQKLEDDRFGRARGIRSLEQSRITEQERILANRLGISEERISELMREMDTPGEVESRRQSAGYGALSSMFLNPDFAAGIGGMGKKITAMDDILRAERKTALGDIFGEREKGAALEDLKRKGIFDTTIKSQKDWDTANDALANFDVTLATETASRGRLGAEAALDAYMKLAESQARQIGAWNSTMASIQAQVQTASLDRENFLSDPKNWEAIANQLDDMRSRIAGLSDPELRRKQEEMVDRLEQFYIGAVGMSGESAARALMSRDPRMTSVTDMTEEIPTGVAITGVRGRVRQS